MREVEGETLEFKKSLSDFDEILATISAFSNTKGGRILVGVDDNGRIVGVDLGKRTLEDIASKIAQNTDPRVYPEIVLKKVGDKNIIEIRVSERDDKPIFAKGVAYKRVGRSNMKMDRDEIVNLLRRTYELSYEDIEVASLDKIDLSKARSFIHRARDVRSASIPEDELTVLRNIGLIDSRAKLAALLLFGKNPQSEAPWAIVKVGKFLSGEFVPMLEKEIDGDLVEQIEKSYGEVLSLIKKEVKIRGVKREEIFEYPPEAIRELIVNAVAHRDYSIKSPIYIKIYDDKIVIENPGGLPPGITVDELKKPHRSILRNPKIANVLYNLGYIEKWGIGTLEVTRKCLLNGNGEPIFQSNGFFRVEIKSRYVADLNDKERLVLKYIRERGRASRSDLEKLLKLKESSVRKLLERLQSRGLVVKEGKGRNIKYKLAY